LIKLYKFRTSSVLFVCLGLGVSALAAQEVSATTAEDGPAGLIPYVKGFNASVGTTSQHDSSNGWSSLLMPNLAYRFDRHFSFDVGAPIYTYINVVQTKGTKAKPVYTTATKHFVAGDTSLNGHFQAASSLFEYGLTASLGLPSGNSTYGLGAGQVTYSFVNSFEKSVGMISPSVELGIGDSSSLDQTRVRKSYVAVGTMAHFQAGLSVDLPRNASFSASAYEELPLSTQTLLSTTGRGKKKVTTSTSKSVGEDNGFQTSLDIPVNGHTTLSGFYNRSLRSRTDTAGFSLTFLLKANPREGAR
jgi:hypothetical protein